MTHYTDSDGLQYLTEAGRKILRDDSQMDDEDRLILEIMNHIDAIDEENACLVYEDLVGAFGSVTAAIEAFKNDRVHLYWGEDTRDAAAKGDDR